MSNYDLEEDILIKFQIVLSFIFIFTLFISICLSYNSVFKLEKRNSFFTNEEAIQILRINRTISLLISFGFVFINVCDKKIKKRYNKNSINSDLQIIASIITLISSLIVLYVAFSSGSSIIGNQNPES